MLGRNTAQLPVLSCSHLEQGTQPASLMGWLYPWGLVYNETMNVKHCNAETGVLNQGKQTFIRRSTFFYIVRHTSWTRQSVNIMTLFCDPLKWAMIFSRRNPDDSQGRGLTLQKINFPFWCINLYAILFRSLVLALVGICVWLKPVAELHQC